MRFNVEIIGVGNELLIGKIANTNAQWLAKSITNLGVEVKRIVDIGDDLEDISIVLKEAISRNPSWVLITGGLGPTFDDITLNGISKALNLPLTINDEALKMVQAKYTHYQSRTGEKIELTPARLKMATIPKSGEPLRNPLGTAPGVMIRLRDIVIVALPGVPKEMQAIFEQVLEPLLAKNVGGRYLYSKCLKATGIIESSLAPLIDIVRQDSPDVYIKSHPKEPEPIPVIEFHLYTTSESKENSKKKVEEASEQLIKSILQNGGKIEMIYTD